MKFFFLLFCFALLVCSCSNEQNNNTVSTTTDTTITTTVLPETTKPTPKKSSKYIALNASTFAGKIAEHQGKAFVDLVEPKQSGFKAATNALIVRRDTLYEVQYLPFKDQELYLHSIVIERLNEEDVLTNWCFSVLKNGATIREDQLISSDFFSRVRLEKMNVGDTELVFVGTKEDGTTETFKIPYDGKKI